VDYRVHFAHSAFLSVVSFILFHPTLLCRPTFSMGDLAIWRRTRAVLFMCIRSSSKFIDFMTKTFEVRGGGHFL
jgi:hypothetical protein